MTDSHRNAPVGFGVKIGATKKTYLIQHRLGSKVLQVKVGNVSDFVTIDAARDEARKKAKGIKATGKNPNVSAREKSAAEKTLGYQLEQAYQLKGVRKPLSVRDFTGAVSQCNWGAKERDPYWLRLPPANFFL